MYHILIRFLSKGSIMPSHSPNSLAQHRSTVVAKSNRECTFWWISRSVGDFSSITDCYMTEGGVNSFAISASLWQGLRGALDRPAQKERSGLLVKERRAHITNTCRTRTSNASIRLSVALPFPPSLTLVALLTLPSWPVIHSTRKCRHSWQFVRVHFRMPTIQYVLCAVLEWLSW